MKTFDPLRAPQLLRCVILLTLALGSPVFGAAVSNAFTRLPFAKTGDPAPGTTNRFGLFGRAFIDTSDRIAFTAGLTDEFGALNFGNGIWRSDFERVLHLVIRSGDQAPGTNPAVRLSDVQIAAFNGLGRLAFIGTLQGGGRDGLTVLYIERDGDAGFVEITFNGADLITGGDVAFNSLGRTAFYGGTTDGTYGLWQAQPTATSVDLQLIATAGMAAPDTEPGTTFAGFGLAPTVNYSGQSVFVAGLTGPAVVSGSNDSGLFIGGPNGVQLVVRSGDQVPDLPTGNYFVSVGAVNLMSTASINRIGQIAFETLIGGLPNEFAGNTAICAGGPGALRVVARTGEHPPGTPAGAEFTALRNPAIDGSGRVLFYGGIDGTNVVPPQTQGIWSSDNGLKLVALAGTELAGAGGPSFPVAQYGVTAGGHIWLSGSVVPTNGNFFIGAWVSDFYGRFSSVVRAGDTFPFGPGDNRAIDAVSVCCGNYPGGEDGRSSSVNRMGNMSPVLQLAGGGEVVIGASVDSDGDGLWDIWESNGIDLNNDGILELDLPALGANPLHKDLFVEVDAMVGRAPHPSVALTNIAGFAAVPNSFVHNPDGQPGIALHFQLSDTNIPLADWTTLTNTIGNGFDWVHEFDACKGTNFGTMAERMNANWPLIREAKVRAFRYCVFANTYNIGDGPGSSGIAELPGNDFMVTLGHFSWTNNNGVIGGTPEQQAGTFMHELGHTLGLQHGGSDDILYKPNYISVMNYSWQFPRDHNRDWWRLDYSREEFPPLDEKRLFELRGLGATNTFVRTFFNNGNFSSNISYALTQTNQPADWNGDDDIEANPVHVDLTHVNPDHPSSPDQYLVGHQDWSALDLRLGGNRNYADGAHAETTAHTELTSTEAAFLASIPPPTLCPLRLRRQDSEVVLTWNCAGTLASAPAVTGPWTRLTNAVSPFTNSITGPAKFFRLEN